MTIAPEPDNDEALDEEVREDEAVWDKARAQFDGFRQDHEGQPTGAVEKALHKWLRHHGITMDDEALRANAAKIATGETVELADIPSLPG